MKTIAVVPARMASSRYPGKPLVSIAGLPMIEHVRRSLKLARDHEKPYLFLGRLYKVIGKPEAAGKMFTRAVQVQPRSVEALRELRLIDLRRRKKGLIGRLLRR